MIWDRPSQATKGVMKPIWNQPFKKKHQTNWELFVAGRDYYLFCRHCCEREAKPSTTYRVYIFPASFWGRWILDLWHCMPGKSRKIENWSRHWEQPWICCSCKGAATEHSPPVRRFPRRVTGIRRIYCWYCCCFVSLAGKRKSKCLYRLSRRDDCTASRRGKWRSCILIIFFDYIQILARSRLHALDESKKW